MFVKDADPLIIQDLEARGLLFRAERLHPHLPVLLALRHAAAVLRPRDLVHPHQPVQGSLVELNQQINWVPEHIKNGRFGNWLENNVDWALGRERYWGTPLPVWECESCQHRTVRRLGGGAVEQLTGRDLSDLDLHRPYVDEVTFPCPKCGGRRCSACLS